MSVPMWERGSAPGIQSRARVFLGCLLTLLLAAAAHADEMARNESSFAKTKPGHVQNMSIHYKTVRVTEAPPLAVVSPEAVPAGRNGAAQPLLLNLKPGGAMQAQPVIAAAANDVQPPKLAVPPRFVKADDEAGRASPSAPALQRPPGVAIYDIEKGRVFLPNGETLEAVDARQPCFRESTQQGADAASYL
jgi:hypothetical protein